MCELLKGQGGVVDIGQDSSGCRNNQIGEIGEHRLLHGVGHLLGEVDGSDILSAKGSERSDDFLNLFRKFAGGDENETSSSFQRGIGLLSSDGISNAFGLLSQPR